MSKKRVVIIGATSAMAEHCARLWVENQHTLVDVVLVGRDLTKTTQVAADLQVRNPQAVVEVHTVDFVNPVAIAQLVDSIAAHGAIDTVLIAHGLLPDQLICQQDLVVNHQALSINGISCVLFAEAFVGVMEQRNTGTLAVISSVAGDRGRKSNYVYGSAKAMVTRYVEGLQHRLSQSHVKVVLIKPGPTDTPMTAHLKAQGGRLANVADVAKVIVGAIDQGVPLVYAPRKWRWIMLVIVHLPRFIFNKLNI